MSNLTPAQVRAQEAVNVAQRNLERANSNAYYEAVEARNNLNKFNEKYPTDLAKMCGYRRAINKGMFTSRAVCWNLTMGERAELECFENWVAPLSLDVKNELWNATEGNW